MTTSDTTPTAPTARGRITRTLIKVLVLAGAVAVLQHTGGLDPALLDSLSPTAAQLGMVGAGIVGVALLNAWRWRTILAQAGMPIPMGESLRIVLIGFYYNLIMPGGSGGDLARIWCIAKDNPGRRVVAGATVVLDRLFGVTCLLVLGVSSIALLFVMGVDTLSLRGILQILLIILGLAVVAVLVLLRLARHPAASSLSLRGATLKDITGICPRGMALVLTVAASFGLHLCAIMVMMACAGMLGYTGVGPLGWLAMVPIASLVNQIPFSPGGIGLGEISLFTLLSRMGPAAGANPGAYIFILFRLSFFLLGMAGMLFMRKNPSLAKHLSKDSEA